MSMEGETADLLVKVLLDGSERLIRLSGSATVMTGKLLVFICALLQKNTAKDIALNPTGMCMAPIPEDNLKDFAKMAKQYNLKYFVAKDKLYKDGFQDICAKSEDTAVINRIYKKLGINVLEKSEGRISNLTEFKDAAEVKKQLSVSFDRALNRITERDYSKDTPRFVCERLNPNQFIELNSSRDMYRGEEYTKTVYTVYKDGEKIGDYNDGRFDGRQKSYWSEQKAKMKMEGNFSDDIIFFDEVKEFNHYRSLHNLDNIDKPLDIKELKEQVEKEISDLKIGKNTKINPIKASDNYPFEAGVKNIRLDENPIHKFVEQYKLQNPVKVKGKVKEIGR